MRGKLILLGTIFYIYIKSILCVYIIIYNIIKLSQTIIILNVIYKRNRLLCKKQ